MKIGKRVVIITLFPFFCYSLSISKQQLCLEKTKSAITKGSDYLTPFEQLMKSQLRAVLTRHITRQSSPKLSNSEEIALWLASLYSLYRLGRLSCGKRIMIPLGALDAFMAYAHHPIYKSLGYYPSFNHVGIPSFSLMLAIGLAHIWISVRRSLENTFFDKHKSFAQLAADSQTEEIVEQTVKELEKHYAHLKDDLVEKGLYKFLYLAGSKVAESFDEIDFLIQKQDSNTYYRAFKLVSLVETIIHFINEEEYDLS